jgi:hypothetical protein
MMKAAIYIVSFIVAVALLIDLTHILNDNKGTYKGIETQRKR